MWSPALFPTCEPTPAVLPATLSPQEIDPSTWSASCSTACSSCSASRAATPASTTEQHSAGSHRSAAQMTSPGLSTVPVPVGHSKSSHVVGPPLVANRTITTIVATIVAEHNAAATRVGRTPAFLGGSSTWVFTVGARVPSHELPRSLLSPTTCTREGSYVQLSLSPLPTIPQPFGTHAVSYPFECHVVCSSWPCRSIRLVLPHLTLNFSTVPSPYPLVFWMSSLQYTPGPSMPPLDLMNPEASMLLAANAVVPWKPSLVVPLRSSEGEVQLLSCRRSGGTPSAIMVATAPRPTLERPTRVGWTWTVRPPPAGPPRRVACRHLAPRTCVSCLEALIQAGPRHQQQAGVGGAGGGGAVVGTHLRRLPSARSRGGNFRGWRSRNTCKRSPRLCTKCPGRQ